MPSTCTITLGFHVTWRAKLLMRWYVLKHRLGFAVDLDRAAERIAASFQYTVDGKIAGRRGR